MYNLFTKDITHQHLPICDSTNSKLIADIKSGDIDATSPYMLTASQQTKGRGQHDRTWQSPKGNVYLSLYHPLDRPLSGLLSLVVGYQLTRLSIIQQINRERLQNQQAKIGVKWANDVGFYHDEQALQTTEKASDSEPSSHKLIFNKLSGILLEPVLTNSRLSGVVVGVGLNVNNAPKLNSTTQEGMDYQAIGLNQMLKELGQDVVHAEDLYLPIGHTILRAVDQFRLFDIDPNSIHQFMNDYGEMDVLAGHKLTVKQPNKTLHGIASGINPNGSLRLSPSLDGGEIIDIYTGTLSVKAKSVKAKSVKAKSVKAKSVKAKSVKAKSVKAKSVKAKSVKAKSVKAQSVKAQSVKTN